MPSPQSTNSSLNLEELPPKERAAALIKLLSTPVEPVERTGAYLLGIVLMTLVMIVLLLVYVAMIVGVGWGIFYHLTAHRGLFNHGGLLSLLLYLMPLAVGLILILFMLKPIFSQPYEKSPRRTLKRSQDPLLFLFVEHLCDAIGAPRPEKIQVNCDVNASASLTHGVRSLFSDELTLTIGLPLMAGLSLRQFGGVLAHEFGHFTQGAGMRLTYLAHSINAWFARVVYERDQWDYRLEAWGQSFGLFLSLTKMSLKLIRTILWCLMRVGGAISGYLMRQMEYDADRYETRYFGSNTFATTSRRIGVLAIAYQKTLADLGNFFEEDRLVDNLPRWVAYNMEQFSADQLRSIRELLDSRTPHWFDTHPTDAQRIENAKLENTRGICRVHAPASILSSQFDRLCQVVTKDFYKRDLGKRFRADQMHPFEEMTARQASEKESYQALHRCLQGHYSFFGYREANLKIPDVTQVSISTIQNKLEHLRDKVLHLSKPYGAVLNRLHETDGWLLETYQAEWLRKARFSFPSDLFSHNLTTKLKTETRRDDFRKQQKTIRNTMAEFDRSVQTMIELAIRALDHPELADRIEDSSAWVQELKELNLTRESLDRRVGTVHELRYKYASLSALMSQLDNEPSQELIQTMLSNMSLMTDHLQSVCSALSHVDYPFDHAQEEMKLGMFLLHEYPDKESPGEVYAASDRLLDRYFRLQARILGRKCVLAERVMETLKVKPLPEPTNRDQFSDSDE